MLVAKGYLESGEAATQLRRLRNVSDKLQGFLDGIAENLDEMPFGPNGTLKLDVIDGGKDD